MNVKYVNHLKEEVYLNQHPYRVILKDFFNYEYSTKQSGNKITGFEKDKVKSKTISIDIFSSQDVSAVKNLNVLSDVFEKDIIANIPGRLYFGEWYMTCFVNGRNSQHHGDDILISCGYKVSFEKEVWIKEEKKQFRPQSQQKEESGLDFPTDFSFDFTSGKIGEVLWNVNHYVPSDFELTIYGPCSNPRVLVNGYPYQVFTELESSDYLIINSKEFTITKHFANETTANLYNSRQFTPSVFAKMPGEHLTFNWQGDFGFDITLYLERSEPKW